MGGVLPLSREAVGVFYSLSRLGKVMTLSQEIVYYLFKGLPHNKVEWICCLFLKIISMLLLLPLLLHLYIFLLILIQLLQIFYYVGWFYCISTFVGLFNLNSFFFLLLQVTNDLVLFCFFCLSTSMGYLMPKNSSGSI